MHVGARVVHKWYIRVRFALDSARLHSLSVSKLGMKIKVPTLPFVYDSIGEGNSPKSQRAVATTLLMPENTVDDDSVDVTPPSHHTCIEPSNFMSMGPDFQRYLDELGSDGSYQSSCSSSHNGAAGPDGRAAYMDAVDRPVLTSYLEERCVFFKRRLDALLLCEQSKAGQPGHVQRSAACLEEEWRHLINCLWHIHPVENTKYQKFPLLPVV